MGYQPIIIDDKLLNYLQFYLDNIWVLFFDNPPAEKANEYLFIGPNGQSLKGAGSIFANTLEKYTGAHISPSTLCKIVETSADSANIFGAQERQAFSKGLLHDYDTAKQY